MSRKSLSKLQYIPKTRIEQMSFLELKEAGLIRETQVLYHQIKEDADALKNQGMTIEEIKHRLGEKYFLSVESLHGILYRPIGAR